MKTWITPAPALREFITHYVVLETKAPLASPMIAATEVVLAFGPGHRGVVFDHRSRNCGDAPPVAVVGPRTKHRVDLRSANGFSGLFVTFAPGAFSRLFGVDVSELIDEAYPAEDVLGCQMLALNDALNNAGSIREKISKVETFLLPRSTVAQDERATHRAARSLKNAHGRLELAQLVNACGVSERQFRREFVAQHGMSPKHYARVLRFEYALRLKDSRPWMTWAQISQDAGYYDQMHLVKDCKLLGDAPPTRLAHLATNPLLTLSDESLPTREQALRRA